MSMTRRDMLAGLLIATGGLGGHRGKSALAAPVPKEKPDVGVIWMLSPATGELTGYTPDGKKTRTVKLADGPIYPMTFLGITGDGQNALFAGKKGVMPVGLGVGYDGLHARTLTVQLRPLFGDGKLIDTAIPCQYGNQYVCGQDGKTLFVTRDTAAPVAAGKSPNKPLYETTAYDLTTFKGIKQPALPEHFALHEVLPNGDRLLSRYVPQAGQRQSFHLQPAGGGKAKLLTGDDETDYCTLSRDGTKFLVTRQHNLKTKPGDSFHRMFVIDQATGRTARFAEHDNTLTAQGHWSPDGKDIVYEWYEEGQQAPVLNFGRLVPTPISRGEVVVCDEHGGNSKVLLKLEGCGDDDFGRFQQWSQNRARLVGWFPTRGQR